MACSTLSNLNYPTVDVKNYEVIERPVIYATSSFRVIKSVTGLVIFFTGNMIRVCNVFLDDDSMLLMMIKFRLSILIHKGSFDTSSEDDPLKCIDLLSEYKTFNIYNTTCP